MLEVLFRNDDILVLDKPAGLAVQPGAGVRTSPVEAVERQFGFRPFLIHRLDRDTAGCIAVAASSQAASRYSALLADKGRAVKVYRALASGVPGAPPGSSRDAIEVRGERKGEAETRWRIPSPREAASPSGAGAGHGTDARSGCTWRARASHPGGRPARHDFALNEGWGRIRAEAPLYAARLELPADPPVRAEAPPRPISELSSRPWATGACPPPRESDGCAGVAGRRGPPGETRGPSGCPAALGVPARGELAGRGRGGAPDPGLPRRVDPVPPRTWSRLRKRLRRGGPDEVGERVGLFRGLRGAPGAGPRDGESLERCRRFLARAAGRLERRPPHDHGRGRLHPGRACGRRHARGFPGPHRYRGRFSGSDPRHFRFRSRGTVFPGRRNIFPAGRTVPHLL
ncbi:MAG: pseudouridine synthase [Desulfobacterales bacterium]|nr:pseudouridine synthase [Desulfobacterales bacterium]